MVEKSPKDTIKKVVTSGDLDIEERNALRRVHGLSTEREDIHEVEYRSIRLERVILVGVWETTYKNVHRSMKELAALATTAGSMVVDAIVQKRTKPDPATFVGSGKVTELSALVAANQADTIICDGELTLSQLRNLEQATSTKVVDRTWLILDIFASHAKSIEGKAQVSLAQMQYLLLRLRGWGDSLSRMSGSGLKNPLGTRGPGETKLEIDRRRIHKQISRLKKELIRLEQIRKNQKKLRQSSTTPAIAIAGYTNAGKSSLLNCLTQAGVLVDNSLFATLSPTTRKFILPSGQEVTLSDTVGFVRHLPHGLIEAFRSTIEEVLNAQIIVHIVDASDDDPLLQIESVHDVLADVRRPHQKEIIVFNKTDMIDSETLQTYLNVYTDAIVVSTVTEEGISTLCSRIQQLIEEDYEYLSGALSYEDYGIFFKLQKLGCIKRHKFLDDGVFLEMKAPSAVITKYKPYIS